MGSITIKNLGPVVLAELDINKVNVFMGPQSSGKSTIVKTICFCQWLEKQLSLEENFYKYDEGTKMVDEFISYHRLSKQYFSENTEIIYKGDTLSIHYSGIAGTPVLSWSEDKKDGILEYQNNKMIYIPAERNFVSAIPDLERFIPDNDNIKEFIYDWRDARKYYQAKKAINLLNLGSKYSYLEENNLDYISLNENDSIELKHSSSGFQSLVPLLIIVDCLSRLIYEQGKTLSVRAAERLTKKAVDSFMEMNTIGELKKLSSEELLKIVDEYIRPMKKAEGYGFTQFFIEEPEQNLYPKTQKELVYHLLEIIQGERDHRLFLSTHSPYILYALNNCMLGYLVKDKCDKTSFSDSFMDPSKVSVYQIEEGVLKNIQQEDGLIGSNSFDLIMKDVMDDFYSLLEYYGDDEE